jgi:hypothetical protein
MLIYPVEGRDRTEGGQCPSMSGALARKYGRLQRAQQLTCYYLEVSSLMCGVADDVGCQ